MFVYLIENFLNTKIYQKSMDIAEIKRIIQEQENVKNRKLREEKIIEREVDKKLLKRFIKYPNILVVLGIRRCGKSVLSWLLMEGKKYGYINFDDESFYDIQTKDLNTILRALYELYGDIDYLILDEIQNVRGWELFATRLRNTKKIIITGSNSQLLSGELATHLTGRHIDYVLFPFSFREFCIYNGIDLGLKSNYTTEISAKMGRSLDEYIEKGGLPEVYLFGESILKTVFGDIIRKDIIRRYNIRTSIIESLAKYLVTNFASEITFNKLKNVFSIKKVQTIKKYIKYFEDAYIIFVIERFSFKLKEQVIAPKKIYCIDTGIINSISFKSSENRGKLFENVVCIELFRRKHKNNYEIYYWKDHQQKEVDFIIKEGPRVKQLIQVCYDIEDIKVKKREIDGIIKASRELKCNNLLIITEDKEGEETIDRKKIKYIPLWRWLLQ